MHIQMQFRSLFLGLSLVASFGASAASPAVETAEAYMTALIRHDEGSARRLVLAGSQAESDWGSHSAAVARMENAAPGAKLGFRNKLCFEKNASTTVCELILTYGNQDGWPMSIQVQTKEMKLASAVILRPRSSR